MRVIFQSSTYSVYLYQMKTCVFVVPQTSSRRMRAKINTARSGFYLTENTPTLLITADEHAELQPNETKMKERADNKIYLKSEPLVKLSFAKLHKLFAS